MYILDVIPLNKIPLFSPQVLSYFLSEKASPGALVRVSLRGREVNALVWSVAAVRERKLEIKKGSFPLKKIKEILSSAPVLSELQLELAFWMHHYYLASLGVVVKLFLPRTLERRKKPIALEIINLKLKTQNLKTPLRSLKPILFWKEQRMEFYLSEIKKLAKKREQVLFLVPERQKIEGVTKEMKKISGEVAAWHSEIKSSIEFDTWRKTRRGEIKIIVGTRSAVFLPFKNLGLIILDEEENPFYKCWDRQPKYHTKTVALKLAKLSGAKIILGTALPSVESYYLVKKKEYRLIQSATNNQPSTIKVIDLREEIRRGNYSILSEGLQEKIKKALDKKKQTILFVNRRGLARALLCQDCGEVICCDNCDVPMAYHETISNQQSTIRNRLLCHHCGDQKQVPDYCPNCQSWRIKYAGAGTQRVVAELEKFSPSTKIARLDSDIAKTQKQQERICRDFAQQKYDLLVATQLLWGCLTSEVKQVELVAVVLLEQMLNLPDFRSTERTFAILKKLQKLGPQLLVQTYHPELSLLQYLSANQLNSFYQEELQNRQEFLYPPFSQLIKLTYAHKDGQKASAEAQALKKKLEKILNTQILGPVPGFIPKLKGQYVWNVIVKIGYKDDEPSIKERLFGNIPKNWQIDVDPRSLL